MATVEKLTFLLFATALLAVQAQQACEEAEGQGTCADAGQCPADTNEKAGTGTCENEQVCCVSTNVAGPKTCEEAEGKGTCTDAGQCPADTNEKAGTGTCENEQVCCVHINVGEPTTEAPKGKTCGKGDGKGTCAEKCLSNSMKKKGKTECGKAQVCCVPTNSGGPKPKAPKGKTCGKGDGKGTCAGKCPSNSKQKKGKSECGKGQVCCVPIQFGKPKTCKSRGGDCMPSAKCKSKAKKEATGCVAKGHICCLKA